jgi:hypothetical protein
VGSRTCSATRLCRRFWLAAAFNLETFVAGMKTYSCRNAPRSGKVFFEEIAMPAGPVLCAQCDKPEYQCTCEKYCTICKGMENVRLCMDGLYYCPDCREACDVTLADTRGH